MKITIFTIACSLAVIGAINTRGNASNLMPCSTTIQLLDQCHGVPNVPCCILNGVVVYKSA